VGRVWPRHGASWRAAQRVVRRHSPTWQTAAVLIASRVPASPAVALRRIRCVSTIQAQNAFVERTMLSCRWRKHRGYCCVVIGPTVAPVRVRVSLRASCIGLGSFMPCPITTRGLNYGGQLHRFNAWQMTSNINSTGRNRQCSRCALAWRAG
jgi:hypothetical protein